MSGGEAATARQAGGSAKWKWWQKRGVTINQRWLCEWWHGCHVVAGSGQHKVEVGQKERKR